MYNDRFLATKNKRMYILGLFPYKYACRVYILQDPVPAYRTTSPTPTTSSPAPLTNPSQHIPPQPLPPSTNKTLHTHVCNLKTRIRRRRRRRWWLRPINSRRWQSSTNNTEIKFLPHQACTVVITAFHDSYIISPKVICLKIWQRAI